MHLLGIMLVAVLSLNLLDVSNRRNGQIKAILHLVKTADIKEN